MEIAKQTIRSMLHGGDRRSIGRADEVVALVYSRSEAVSQVVECLWDADEVVRMRAADAAEKISREQAALLQRYKKPLLGLMTETTQKELRWHLAVIVPRLRLTAPECRRVAEILQGYLDDRSAIVKTFAMQGLWDLAIQSAPLRPTVVERIRSLTRTGTPAMRARGRILLARIGDRNL
jgi:hypothetical protein